MLDLKRRIDAGEDVFLLDVREPYEVRICRIPGGVPIALGDVRQRLEEIPRDREIVVFCKSGVRSAKAAALLRSAGFARVTNLKGGILEWIRRVDPTLPAY